MRRERDGWGNREIIRGFFRRIKAFFNPAKAGVKCLMAGKNRINRIGDIGQIHVKLKLEHDYLFLMVYFLLISLALKLIIFLKLHLTI